MSLLEDWDDAEESVSSHLSAQSELGYRDISERTQDILRVSENDKIDKEPPIFVLEKVQYKPNGLKHLVVCSNILAMALNNSHVIRLNLKNPEDLEDVEVSRKPEDQIHKLFLDPTGNHLIISMESEDNYYLHSKWKKPKLMSKLKGIVIESVAWNRHSGDTMNTREILLGTSKGKIFEASIEANEKAFMERLALVGTRDQTVRPVYNVGDNMPITGLRFERFAGSDSPKYFVMATTPTRIYQFIGGPTFDQLFSNYETNLGFHELPGELTRSELQFFSKYQGLPKSFAWLTGPGIYHGDLIFGSQNPGDSVMTDTTLLPYMGDNNAKAPISLLLSEFHFILLYPQKIQAISTLKKKVVWEEYFGKSQKLGEIRGLALDPINKTAWLYSEYAVYEIIITKEDRNVWEMYLEKGQYEAALQYCKTPSQKDRVWSQQADYYFSSNNYKLAATYYGKSHKPFEEIALRFISISDINALKTYLLSKLENIKKANNATQVTLIATWLTEIYLDKLNQLRDNRLKTLMNGNTSSTTANLKDAHDALQEEFEQFLKDYKDNLDKSTTYNLISSHGRIEDLLFYANLIEDFDTVIHHHIQRRDFPKALDVMAKQPDEDLFYKFSPALMEEIPFYTVNCWIRADQLDSRKLIPALMRYNHSNNKEDPQTNQAIRYLQHCVKKLNNTDPVIHNYLLTLYAKDSDDGPLLKFLSQPDRHFDEKYALRLCTKENKTTACVLIYSAMGLYEEAVDLALKVDLDLAKINADKPEDDDALRKKLWLKIARHVVEESNIKKAMELLNQCDLLKIEDILPFFPDFTRIDTFKDEICSSLEDYNRHIETLKVEMEEATKSANLIRKDIKELRNRYGYVSANSVCDVCDLPVLTREFYLFPCEHVFHADCLKSEMTRHLDNVQRGRVNELQQQIQQLSLHGGALQSSQSTTQKRQPQTVLTQTGPQKDDENITVSVSVSKLEKLKDDLDDLIAGECLLCGDVIIKSIADPFIQPSELMEIESWSVM